MTLPRVGLSRTDPSASHFHGDGRGNVSPIALARTTTLDQHAAAPCLIVRVTRGAQMGQVPSAARETASPNGPCVIRRPAVSVSSTSNRKGVAGITQDWYRRAHACSFPD